MTPNVAHTAITFETTQEDTYIEDGIAPNMSTPAPPKNDDDVAQHLHDALEATDCEKTGYHIRQALQLQRADAEDTV